MAAPPRRRYGHETPQYQRYITSKKWRDICARYWKQHGRHCQSCGSTQGSLDVHHATYIRFGGKELLSDLVGLCRSCHDLVHECSRTKSVSILRATRLVTGLDVREKPLAAVRPKPAKKATPAKPKRKKRKSR